MADKKIQTNFEQIGAGKIERPESSPERAGEFRGAVEKPGIVAEKMPAESQGVIAATNAQHGARLAEKEIESVLEKDMAEIYMNLSQEKKIEFKIKGEETAREINNLLQKTKVKIGDIIRLIKNWLAIIPGVNKFFLEQEAKIKADEIMKMKNKI